MTSRPRSAIVGQAYDRVLRPYLPSKVAVWNGVAVRGAKLLDATDHRPEFKDGFIGSIHEAVSPGDTVVDIGGGYGVAAVVAARMTGPDGHVKTYEAAAEQTERLRETLRLNGVADRVEAVHGVVGVAGETIYGDDVGEGVSIERACKAADVLVMDCEGAEVRILQALTSAVPPCEPPPTVVVEAHPPYGGDRETIRSLLRARGDYEIMRDVDAGPGDFARRAITGVRR